MTTARRDKAIVLGFWLLVAIVMTWLSWPPIKERKFPDPDDVMRLLQVRDWVAGQSWFDVTQYRLNVPAGAPMHWSRLVDIPIAAVILLFRPFVGQFGAETASIIVVPLVTLGIVMVLVHAIAARMMTSRAALVAALATPFTLGTLKQMRPMRVDHHGWQIVAALVALLAAFDDRQRRSGWTAGLAMAVWLNISIEGLPFAAAVGALFAWRWIADSAQAERLKSYLAAIAVGSLGLFALTHLPSTWLNQPRDVITPAHLAAFAAAWIASAFAVRPAFREARLRLMMAALVGGSALAAIFAVDPHWLTGPFGSLPPLVKTMWYNRVDEGLPVWRVDWAEGAMAMAQPLVGIAGAIAALTASAGEQRQRLATYLFLLAAATLASLYVIRFGTTASILALPGTALLCQLAFRRARTLSFVPVRAAATAGALCIMAPAYAVPLSVAPDNDRLQSAFEASTQCLMRSNIEKLSVLPPGQIAAGLDITPALLLNTPHSAFASGHHRNAAAMNDVISLFLYAPDVGAKILANRHADYVLICTNEPESIRYSARGPGGLMARLRSGQVPQWLEPVRVPGLKGLQVWRVRKEMIAA